MALFVRKTMADRLQENANRMGRRLGRRARHYGDIAQLRGHRMSKEASRMAHSTRRYLSRHPMASVGILAVLVALIGFMLGRMRR